MLKALIVTVGRQCEQIKYCLNQSNPEYLVILGTNTAECENSINELVESYKIKPTNLKIYNNIEDTPESIGRIIKYFKEGVDWLTIENKIPKNEIEVDPTGGRKWMSAGLTMIASFINLKMIYIQDKPEMKIIPLGNAYQQIGFLEEAKADNLFNKCNYPAAIEIYETLAANLTDPRNTEIKKAIAESYLRWTQFKFTEAFNCLEHACKNIKRYKLHENHLEKLQVQLQILNILKKNDDKNISYFKLLSDNEFSLKALLFLFNLQNMYSKIGQLEQAVVVVYRILEFISQYRLAQNGIDSGNVQKDIREKYNEKFKEMTGEQFLVGSVIRDKVGLLDGWVLLFCIQDKIIKGLSSGELKGLRAKTEPRNNLWIEHRNKSTDKESYENFRRYVEKWLVKVLPQFETEIKNYEFISF